MKNYSTNVYTIIHSILGVILQGDPSAIFANLQAVEAKCPGDEVVVTVNIVLLPGIVPYTKQRKILTFRSLGHTTGTIE